MAPEVIAVVGTLGGVLVASVANLANNLIIKRAEERTKTKELVVNAAIENWKQLSEQTIKLHASSPGSTATIYPLDLFIVYMAKVCDFALKPNISRDELSSKLTEAGEMLEVMIAERMREEKQRKLKRRDSATH